MAGPRAAQTYTPPRIDARPSRRARRRRSTPLTAPLPACPPAVIEYAEPDYRVGVNWLPNDPMERLQWHHAVVGSEEAWNASTGRPEVRVCHLDSGVRTDHPDLAARVAMGWNLVPEVQASGEAWTLWRVGGLGAGTAGRKEGVGAGAVVVGLCCLTAPAPLPSPVPPPPPPPLPPPSRRAPPCRSSTRWRPRLGHRTTSTPTTPTAMAPTLPASSLPWATTGACARLRLPALLAHGLPAAAAACSAAGPSAASLRMPPPHT